MILENLLKLLKFRNLKCDSCEYRNKWICDAFESRSLFLSSPRWRATDEWRRRSEDCRFVESRELQRRESILSPLTLFLPKCFPWPALRRSINSSVCVLSTCFICFRISFLAWAQETQKTRQTTMQCWIIFKQILALVLVVYFRRYNRINVQCNQ